MELGGPALRDFRPGMRRGDTCREMGSVEREVEIGA